MKKFILLIALCTLPALARAQESTRDMAPPGMAPVTLAVSKKQSNVTSMNVTSMIMTSRKWAVKMYSPPGDKAKMFAILSTKRFALPITEDGQYIYGVFVRPLFSREDFVVVEVGLLLRSPKGIQKADDMLNLEREFVGFLTVPRGGKIKVKELKRYFIEPLKLEVLTKAPELRINVRQP
jgi:hypothetical protein